MATQDSPLRQERVRPAKPRKATQARARRSVAGPLQALVGPWTLSQALDHAVPAQRRRAIAQQSGYEAQAQKVAFEPYLRALVVRQLLGGSRRDLQHGVATDPLYEVHGGRLEIAVPGLSKADAQRPTKPFWDVRAEVLAAVAALAQAVRIGRGTPLGAVTPKQLRAIAQLLERTRIFAAPVLELPPQIARWARTSQKQERAGIKVQLRLRAGSGGMDRVRVTGAKGNDNPYVGALLDLEAAVPGHVYLFGTGYWKLASYDQIRGQGCELVTVLHAGITVEVVAERGVQTPVTAQGYTIHSDRVVRIGTGQTRSSYLWRVLEVTDTPGRRRPLLTSLRAETAERSTQLRAYRWPSEIVFRWLKRVLQLDTLISGSPKGVEMQVAVALIGYGVLRQYQHGGALSLKALQRRLQPELHRALFAAGVAEGERRARTRVVGSGSSPPRLRAVG